MVSGGTAVRPLTVLTLALALAIAPVLTGCADATAESAGTPTSARPTPTRSSTALPTPSATPAPPVSQTPAPTAPADPVIADPATARGLAVRACQAVSGGFAAASVAAGAALASQAAAADAAWTTLSADLTFIRDNPIDPETGEGPLKTAEDAAAVAEICQRDAGVAVRQD